MTGFCKVRRPESNVEQSVQNRSREIEKEFQNFLGKEAYNQPIPINVDKKCFDGWFNLQKCKPEGFVIGYHQDIVQEIFRLHYLICAKYSETHGFHKTKPYARLSASKRAGIAFYAFLCLKNSLFSIDALAHDPDDDESINSIGMYNKEGRTKVTASKAKIINKLIAESVEIIAKILIAYNFKTGLPEGTPPNSIIADIHRLFRGKKSGEAELHGEKYFRLVCSSIPEYSSNSCNLSVLDQTTNTEISITKSVPINLSTLECIIAYCDLLFSNQQAASDVLPITSDSIPLNDESRLYPITFGGRTIEFYS